jgi:hypothetical protein
MFDDPEELLDCITSFLEEVQPSELHVVFSHWVERPDGFWRTMETPLTNKSFVDRNISRFVFRRAGATTY